jgi:hypothetical protein
MRPGAEVANGVLGCPKRSGGLVRAQGRGAIEMVEKRLTGIYRIRHVDEVRTKPPPRFGRGPGENRAVNNLKIVDTKIL